METYALIREAILRRRIVIATYHGFRREMCPHVLGETSGSARCLFFQFAGGSRSGLPPGGDWRCIALDSLRNVQVVEGAWHTDPGATRAQHCVATVDVQASP